MNVDLKKAQNEHADMKSKLNKRDNEVKNLQKIFRGFSQTI